MKARLEELYKTNIQQELMKKLGLKNVMEIPRIKKIVLNMGVKEAAADSKVLTLIQDVLTKIAGQAAVKTKAKKSIAGFKLREGVSIGVMVTLRKKNMYCFLDKLVNLALPCVRDFQGVSKSLDGNGNYNLGIKDWMIFPEVDYDKVDKSRGLNITFETTASCDDHARALLECFNIPFRK
jgi:large subunit ribosomal protein L5